MPADVRQVDRIVPLPGVPVRPAHPARADRDDHPVRRTGRVRDLRQLRHDPVARVDERPHEADRRRARSSRASPSSEAWYSTLRPLLSHPPLTVHRWKQPSSPRPSRSSGRSAISWLNEGQCRYGERNHDSAAGLELDEGTFIGWLKSDGQRVSAGEPLFSLEGDKATQDVESLEAGVLRSLPMVPRMAIRLSSER